MLPTNVMSFMKKMVTAEPGSHISSVTSGISNSSDSNDSGGTTFGKLKQTLSSSLLTAQDKVVKMSPRPSLVPEMDSSSAAHHPPEDKDSTTTPNTDSNTTNTQKADSSKPPSRAGACRVCLKAFKPNDFSRTCGECHQRVCEDCASYSKIAEDEDPSQWTCSVCRRKLQSRAAMQQDSSESLLEVPIQELQRRHSEARLGSSAGLSSGSLGGGLAPPRSPETRRHSDVSPASIKELEKAQGSTQGGGSNKTSDDWARRGGGGGGGGRSAATSRANSPPRSRRGSRCVIARQHSYDDEPKTTLMSGSTGELCSDRATGGGMGVGGSGLGLPAPMPRRASAYDVFTVPALSTVTQQVVPSQQQSSTATSQSPTMVVGGGGGPVIAGGGRRSSFRIVTSAAGVEDGNVTTPPSPDNMLTMGIALPDEDRRNRRRGSQLPDIGLRQIPPPRPAPTLEDLEAAPPRRQASVDAEAIRIVIHDVDSGPAASAQRRVILRRDPSDKVHRTRGFGMRVVGGKNAPDGRLFAYIVWTIPGGPAEKGGLQQGDRVLEWDGVSLIDRSFEEVCAIMDRTGDMVELLVEHATDLRMCDFLDDPSMPSSVPSSQGSGSVTTTTGGSSGGGGGQQQQHVTSAGGGGVRKLSDSTGGGGGGGGGGALNVETDNEKTPSSPTRRKLPKTPEQIARERVVSGRVQIQVWYNDERKELIVSVMAADDLAMRDDSLGYGNMPEAYAKLCLMPLTSESHCTQTEVAPASQNPIWNANLAFPGVPGDELMKRVLDISLWDRIPHADHGFLGECTVDLQKAFLDDRAIWCRLEDPRQFRSGRSPHTSPRGSIVTGIGGGRRTDFGQQRSQSDDVDSIGDCASLLHPDQAWGSRRGSSQSEQLEVEVYQLGKDFSRSLPGSRRSSFQSGQEPETIEEVPVSVEEAHAPQPQHNSTGVGAGAGGGTMSSYNRDRRRSSCTRVMRDPDEILKSLKAVKGELGRTMSLAGEKRQRRPSSAVSSSSRKDSVKDSTTATDNSSLSVLSKGNSPPSSPDRTSPPHLGPGQIKPRGFHLTSSRPVELKLGLQMTKGQLELEVVCGRHILGRDGAASVSSATNSPPPPDTYVKSYLREGDRWLQKRKTRVVRHSHAPAFRQTLRYQACDVTGRTLVVMLWERAAGFEHNLGLGGCEIGLDALRQAQLTTGWYPLFPIHSLGSDSNDSP